MNDVKDDVLDYMVDDVKDDVLVGSGQMRIEGFWGGGNYSVNGGQEFPHLSSLFS